MKNKDKLISVITKIANAEGKSPETVVAELNNMTEEEILNKINNMELFKEGGKLDYLLYLKKGGCSKKVKKNQDGGDFPAPTRREARQLAEVNMGLDGRQFRQAYRNAKTALRNENPNLSRAEIRDAARRLFDSPILDDASVAPGLAMPAYSSNAALNIQPQATTGSMDQISDPSQMNNQLSFGRAFGRARKMGLDQFGWRGNDYNTQLAAAPARQPISLYSDPQARQIHADTIAQNQRIMEETGNKGGVGNAIKAGILSTLNYPMK